MLDYKDILTKRYVLRLSLREIAEQTGAGKSGVHDFLKAFEKSEELEYPLPPGITNAGIAMKVYGKVPGKGGRDAIVFFPGGRVEETAYAPLLCAVAERGVDCFLMKMPSRMAVFGANAPDRVLGAFAYERWYVGGHSLGGLVAAKYAAKNAERINGVVLLASYPRETLPEPLSLLCCYGSNDG